MWFGPIMEMLIQIKTAFINADGIMINLKL